MDLAANELKLILRRNGVLLNDTITFKSVVVSLIPFLILVESILSLGYRWKDLNRRFLALEDSNIWFTIFVITSGVAYFKDNVRIVLKILTDPFPVYGIENSLEKRLVIESRVQSSETQIRLMSALVNLIRFNFFAISFFQTMHMLMFADGNSYDENLTYNLYLPYEFYHIYLVKSLTLFFFVNICQIFCSFIFANGARTVFVSFVGPVQRVMLDLKLLCISIKEIEEYTGGDKHRLNEDVHSSRLEEIKLRYYMSKIIEHHGNICNRIYWINKAIPMFAYFGLQSCVSQICLQFYWIAEVDDTRLLQTKDMIQALAIGGYLYFVSSVGQDVLNESEVLRNTIYECSWTDKPLWFKKSLNVMLTMANKSFELKPYGLYIISFESFTSMIRAAYSFFNLLRTFTN